MPRSRNRKSGGSEKPSPSPSPTNNQMSQQAKPEPSPQAASSTTSAPTTASLTAAVQALQIDDHKEAACCDHGLGLAGAPYTPSRALAHEALRRGSAHTHAPDRQMKAFGNPIDQYDPYESMRQYMKLFENNRRWVSETLKEDPDFFERLSKGQKPAFMLIGCSDSRVPPDQLTQTHPGEIFIHRNVANLVVHTDMNLMSVLQYAVEVLRVRHVIVMGHYECGGVKAAMTNEPHGLIDKWLRNIKDVMRLYGSELNKLPPDARFRRLVELNVQEAVFNLYKTSILQAAWAEGDKVQVHGWVCDIRTGLIKDLHVENSPQWKEVESIYELDFHNVVFSASSAAEMGYDRSEHPIRAFRDTIESDAESLADEVDKSRATSNAGASPVHSDDETVGGTLKGGEANSNEYRGLSSKPKRPPRPQRKTQEKASAT